MLYYMWAQIKTAHCFGIFFLAKASYYLYPKPLFIGPANLQVVWQLGKSWSLVTPPLFFFFLHQIMKNHLCFTFKLCDLTHLLSKFGRICPQTLSGAYSGMTAIWGPKSLNVWFHASINEWKIFDSREFL